MSTTIIEKINKYINNDIKVESLCMSCICIETYPCKHENVYIKLSDGWCIWLGNLRGDKIKELYEYYGLLIPEHFKIYQ